MGGYLVLPADTTETTVYVVGSQVPATDYGDSSTITNATNATPIVVTSSSHGLATGDRIVVVDVGGNTNANGEWIVTVVDANSFSLDGSSGNSGYTSGGTFTGALPAFLERFLLAATVADFYRSDGQLDKSIAQEGIAEEYMFQGLDRNERLQQQNKVLVTPYPAYWPTLLVTQTTT